MKDAILRQIMRHLDLLDRSLLQSINIKQAALQRDVDQIIWETENRDKVINIISMFQSNIEDLISKMIPEDISEEFILIIKSWANDLAIWAEKTDLIDQEVVALLENEKEQTTKELAALFNTKNKFKGYNLNNVKK